MAIYDPFYMDRVIGAIGGCGTFCICAKGVGLSGVGAGKPWKEEEKGNQGGEPQDGGI